MSSVVAEPQVRRDYHVRILSWSRGASAGSGSGVDHVQRGAPDPVLPESFYQRLLVNALAAGVVYDYRVLFHQPELVTAQQMIRAQQQRHQDHHHVGFAQQRLEVHVLRAQLALELLRNTDHVVIELPHVEGPAPLEHSPAYPARCR